MNLFVEALQWIFDPANWSGENALGMRILEHLGFSAAVVLAAALIGMTFQAHVLARVAGQETGMCH